MSTVHRLAHTFTSGELSPLMEQRVDFERFQNSCRRLENAYCVTQGPVIRRSGFKFISSLRPLGHNGSDKVRLIPFIFNTKQAYALLFFERTGDSPAMVAITWDGLVATDSGSVALLELPAEWDILNFDYTQSADEIYIAQSGLKPHIIRRTDINAFQLVAVTFTNQPAAWSDANGWPSKVVFHQQRLIFANTKLNSRTVWLSKAGDFSDFGISSPIVDSDAVTFTLDSGTQNAIQWMASSKGLNVGTTGSEWTVTGSNSSAMTPSNIYAREQTGAGSEAISPLKIGHTTMFIEQHGRTVSEFAYSYADDGYVNADLTVLANHLTQYYSISCWTYQQTPNSIIWCIREDGTLLGLTYQRQHKVVGWHRHHTQGSFKAIASMPGDRREDEVIVVVAREVNGRTEYYIEGMERQFDGIQASEGHFLDSYITKSSETPTSLIEGLNHLEGLTVDIIADGRVQSSQKVQNGSLTLPIEYSSVVVGLSYTTLIEPNLSTLSLSTGTSLARMQKVIKLDINFYNSLGCIIGRVDPEDMTIQEDEIPFRVPVDLTGTQVPLYTGWKSVDFMEGYGQESNYYLKQAQPLPFTVRAVIDHWGVN